MASRDGVTIAKGDVLFRQGERPDGLYYLESGSLEVLSAPEEYANLDESIVLSKSRRVGLVREAGYLATFSRRFAEPCRMTLRALDDCSLKKYPLGSKGFQDFVASDPAGAVTALQHGIGAFNATLAVASRYLRLYMHLCIMEDNFALLYHDLSGGDAFPRLNAYAGEVADAFSRSGGALPGAYGAKFLVTDLSKYLRKRYDAPGGSADARVDKKLVAFIQTLVQPGADPLKPLFKADAGIAAAAQEAIAENYLAGMEAIGRTAAGVEEKLGILFGGDASWSVYLADRGGFNAWKESGKLSPDFMTQLLALMVKLSGIYEELSGRKIADFYPGLRKLTMLQQARAARPDAPSADADDDGRSVGADAGAGGPDDARRPISGDEDDEGGAISMGPVKPIIPAANVSGALKRSMQQIFEFSMVDKDFQKGFVKLLNEFKAMKNPFNTEQDGRKVRRNIARMYWDIYKQAFVRSKSESTVPQPVQLMLSFGYLDEELLEEKQILELVELQRVKEKVRKVPVVLETEFLSQIHAGKVEPSITEMGLNYEGFLRELEKSRSSKKKADEENLDENVKRTMFEIEQRLASSAAVCSGATSTAFPILNAYAMRGSLKSLYAAKSKVESIITELVDVDFSAFYRETVLRLDNDAREIIQEEVYPFFILLPIYGSKTLLWQDLSGTNKRSRGRIVIPIFFMGDLKRSLGHTMACFRWELNRTIKGALWADPIDGGLTGEYFDYVNTFKKNSKLSAEAKDKIAERFKSLRTNRDRFADDYLSWVFYEKDGIMKLNAVVREMFYRYVPFRKETRERLITMPAFGHAGNRYKNIHAREVAAFQRKFKKYQDPQGAYPEAIQKFFEFLDL